MTCQVFIATVLQLWHLRVSQQSLLGYWFGVLNFYLRPPQIYKSPIPSVRSFRCQSQHFDPLTIFRFSRNSVSICTSKKVTSGHMSQGRPPKVKVTFLADISYFRKLLPHFSSNKVKNAYECAKEPHAKTE